MPVKHEELGQAIACQQTGTDVLGLRSPCGRADSRNLFHQPRAELLQALVDKHPHETVYVAWDNASTHEDDEIEAVVRRAAGRLVLLYLPTYSPWLNPAEMLWRHFRREVTHCELFESIKAVIAATLDFFQRCNAQPHRVLSIIGSNAA